MGTANNNPGELAISRIFVIGDTHFDHANIIKYRNRPFSSAEEMNAVMLNNWNSTVKDNDIVYFLGDLSHGGKGADYWLGQLKGRITFIRGSHDEKMRASFVRSALLNYGGLKFFLVHDPADAPKHWQGWIVHGHHHNCHPEQFPFISREARTVNASAELIGYKPMLIDDVVSAIIS